ncbi:S8 family peptidase [Muricauda sp. SCSIO 64092]|uniref:S8 family peptidase n=1 Tax=Allomuricauda sp. SCSIO 64092 TaxID=2908842 RepID=UPI001FF13A4B|nr:S8 family peptidase [Muricauda sp. SCSIO 64092]UOY06191.1 S8 family peptidase [Muricauda sp. SCSIO 64092]
MKKLNCTLILLFCFLFNYSQEHYYWYKNQKIPLKINTGKHYLTFLSNSGQQQMASSLGIESSKIVRFGTLDASTNINEDITVGKFTNWCFMEGSAPTGIQKNREITYTSPFFFTEDGIEAGLSHLFYVKLKESKDIKLLQEMAEKYGVRLIGTNVYMPLWVTLSCSKDSKGNALEMANLFYESGKFSASQPDLMTDDGWLCTNDPSFNNQWGLLNTGQHGGNGFFDINYCGARQISTGDAGITVAVLDEGVEMNHPDLPNMHPISFDTTTSTSPSLVRGAHGTAVAGIIGANDNTIGVTGIAPDCQIMSISNRLSPSPASRMRRADGINFAVNNGADVINNSWGSPVRYPVIDDAITNAFTNGRGGRGCVVVFGAGNDNGSVNYPANSNNDILTVGAMSPCGERKNPNSCDGENYWGSSFGSTLDVMAPGVLIPTTDEQGSDGYNTATGVAGNYNQTFTGTSAAAPHVAGLAALILSVNPDIDFSEVNNIIESTAQKVGGYTYTTTSGRQNGIWDHEMGYGLINAEAALQKASFSINGANGFCPSTSFSISPEPGNGVTVSWSVSPSNAGTFSTNGQATTFTRSGSFTGQATISAQIVGDRTVTVTKVVKVEITPINSIDFSNGYDGQDYFCTSHYGNTYRIYPNRPNTTYQYRLRRYPNLNVVYTSPTGQFNTGTITYIPPTGFYEFQVRSTNPCGSSTWAGYEVEYIDCSQGGGEFLFSVSPNPASSAINITPLLEKMSSESELLDGPDEITLTLFDFSGQPVQTRTTMSNLESKMDVSLLRKGMYFLKIVGRKENETHQVVIE